jgi:hypothetical protein
MKVRLIIRYASHLCPVKKHPAELLPPHVPEMLTAGPAGGEDATLPQESNNRIAQTKRAHMRCFIFLPLNARPILLLGHDYAVIDYGTRSWHIIRA